MARAAPRIAVLLLLLHHIHRAVAGFISVNGTAFVDINACGSDPLKLAGFNTYRAVEYAMREPQRMFEQLDSAASAGLNFVRSWAFSTKAEMSLLSSDGSFNEEVLVGLDKFLTACKERNIRVILVLIDWWQVSIVLHVCSAMAHSILTLTVLHGILRMHVVQETGMDR